MSEFRAPALKIVATERRERSELRVPTWYRRKCEAQAFAVWAGQLTERESALELRLWHTVMMCETTRERRDR